ncbi:hypothetical protein lerEdw1_009258 [Lerista edwardsae]|nr:hypothetical protein lerEdw1_009258 [Lerista edwardsae]
MRPLLALVHRHPWVINVATYGTLFSAADVAQQVLARPSLDLPAHDALDLKQTGKVALVGFAFHANFNFVWFRALERCLPGANATKVIAKVACDQVVAAPITIGAFYTGESRRRSREGAGVVVGGPLEMVMSFSSHALPLQGLSFLDGESDIYGKLQEKFWPTYKAGVLCWTLFQAVNFTLVPPLLRTAYVGACSFLWTAFLCYLRQSDAHDATSRLFRAVPGLAGLFPPTAGKSQVNQPAEK